MNFYHEFEVPVAVEHVTAFHKLSASMATITPPPIVVNFHQAPTELADGDVMRFTLWVGPMPIKWSARIEWTGPSEFVDHQVAGPYGAWSHRHLFVALGPKCTKVIDDVQAHHSTTWWRQLITRGMWAGMPLLFAYRAWRTKRLLVKQVQAQQSTLA